MAYILYAANGTTPLTTPQPSGSTFETISRGTFADGRQRIALGKRVEWRYSSPISAAQYQQLVVARLSGRQIISTWVRPEGGVAGHFALATAQMQETIPGVLQDGEYFGVVVTFLDVREV